MPTAPMVVRLVAGVGRSVDTPKAFGKECGRTSSRNESGLYESRRTAAGWSPKVKLGPGVNVNGTDIGALFSPSGRSLLFSRDLKGSESGEFFVWHETGAEAWPPECPPSR